MHAATLDSERLKRVDDLLADGRPHSTLAIMTTVQVCAVNSVISELRANGRRIRCWREGGRWFYQREDV